MEEGLAEKLMAAIVIRNRLIHRYLTVKEEELWSFAGELSLETTPQFSQWVRRIAKSG